MLSFREHGLMAPIIILEKVLYVKKKKRKLDW